MSEVMNQCFCLDPVQVFRVYLNEDPVGVEVAGALQNCIATAAGICERASIAHQCPCCFHYERIG